MALAQDWTCAVADLCFSSLFHWGAAADLSFDFHREPHPGMKQWLDSLKMGVLGLAEPVTLI